MKKVLGLSGALLVGLLLAAVAPASPAPAPGPGRSHVCEPCGMACDAKISDHPGTCPDRGARLVEEASVKIPALPAGRVIDEPRRLLWSDGVKNAYPRWSRDGSRILFQSNRTGTWQIHVMHADGSHETQLTRDGSNNNFPDWSPDNKAIAFASDRDGNEEVYIMGADGQAAHNLSRHPARDIHPYWSPDGKKILFNSTRDVERLQVYEMNPDGTGLRRLVVSDDDDSCARVSPAGDRIVYLTNLTGGADDVIVRDRDGSHPRNITNDPPADGWPTWTPDGKHIVFASRRARTFALYVMDPDGSNVRPITDPQPPDSDGRPSLSRDGKRIVFNRDRGETIGIFVVDLR